MIRHNGIAIDTKLMCVEHGGVTVYFTPQVFRLMHALLLAGPKTTKELAAIIYRDNDDGGPVTWNNCIAAQIWALRPRIAALGLELHRVGPHTFRVNWVAPSPAATRAEAA